MLKGENFDVALSESWAYYYRACINLIYLTQDDASNITFLDLKFFEKLKGLFLGYEAIVYHLPSSIEIFVSYNSKEKYQKPKRCVRHLQLDAPKCTQLKLL
jgi:hypothetical protein